MDIYTFDTDYFLREPEMIVTGDFEYQEFLSERYGLKRILLKTGRGREGKELLIKELEFICQHQWIMTYHPNILHIFGRLPDDHRGRCSGLVLEIAGKNLSSVIKTLDKRQQLSVAHGIISGLDYIHSKEIAHGELTADNVFLAEDLTAKITNFCHAGKIGTKRTVRNSSSFFKYYLQVVYKNVNSQIDFLQDLSINSDIRTFGVIIGAMSADDFQDLSQKCIEGGANSMDILQSLEYHMKHQVHKKAVSWTTIGCISMGGKSRIIKFSVV